MRLGSGIEFVHIATGHLNNRGQVAFEAAVGESAAAFNKRLRTFCERLAPEELHATDYQLYAYLQMGRDRAARRLVDMLPEIGSRFDPNRVSAGGGPSTAYFALAAIPARYALERGAWADAAKLDARATPYPWVEAMTHFARALGAARGGDVAAARKAVETLPAFRDQLIKMSEAYWAEQVEIQRRGASAWIAFAERRTEDALRDMRIAADREDATEKAAVTPGPLAPAREMLGEMLLQLNEPAQALEQFAITLTKEPNRFRALAGAAQAAAAAGDRAPARKYATLLLKIAARADKPERRELQQARRLVAARR